MLRLGLLRGRVRLVGPMIRRERKKECNGGKGRVAYGLDVAHNNSGWRGGFDKIILKLSQQEVIFCVVREANDFGNFLLPNRFHLDLLEWHL